jgi:integrase
MVYEAPIVASGHVVKRKTKSGGTVWGVVVNRDRDPVTGNRRRTRHGSYKTRSEAQSALRRILTEIDSGVFVERTDLTVREYIINVWWPAHTPTIRANTAASYDRVIAAHIIPGLGSVRLQKLTPAMLTGFYGRLSSGDGSGREPLSSKSVRHGHVFVRRALADAVLWGYLSKNPADAAKPPRMEKDKKFKTWTAAQLRRFLDHVGGTGWEALFTLLATTGMRRSEAMGLWWDDIDFDGHRLSIVRTYLNVGGTPAVSEPKTGSSARSISLDTQTVEVLRNHRRHAVEQALATGMAMSEFVFAGRDGMPVKPDRVTRTFTRLSEQAGLPHIRLHDLRHTWATLALRNGVHPKVVQERLGHANISTTLNTYSHVTEGMQSEAAEEIANLILPVRPSRT